MTMVSPVKITGSISNTLSLMGERNPPSGPALASNSVGSSNSMPPSTCASPMVATVSTSRDCLAKRRMTRNSTMPPSASPRTTATGARPTRTEKNIDPIQPPRSTFGSGPGRGMGVRRLSAVASVTGGLPIAGER